MSDECARCPDPGMCCRYLALQLAGPMSLDAKKWVELHPGLSVYDHNDETFIRIDIPCSALNPTSGLCDLHGTKLRPRLCGEWPGTANPRLHQAPEGCVFLTDLELVGPSEPLSVPSTDDPSERSGG